ncbi:MAG: polyphosphate kinase 1 [Bdellovibrionaceae bacterium]|nr:polyphosphate kinase 1 [Pseudobdellovibrionaceae bacterium]
MVSGRGTLKTTSRKRVSSRKPKPRVVEHPKSSAELFTNRETGWLAFNSRVLHEALDPRTPLLERVRFLAISDSNLDEFFMKRVGGLKRQIAAGIAPKSADGKTPLQQIQIIRQKVLEMVVSQSRCYENLLKELRAAGIFLLQWKELSAAEREWVAGFYKRNIFPVLTPLSVDPGHPFPFMSNLSTSLGVTLKHPDQEEKLFARIKIPKGADGLPQWLPLPSSNEQQRFVSLTDVVRENLADLFPAMQVIDVMPFRITRNADSDSGDDGAEDLLETIAEELRQRRFAEVVRLEHGPNPDPWMLQFLKDELEITDEDIYEHPGVLDYSDLIQIANLAIPHLRYPSHQPVTPLAFTDESASIFQVIRHSDQLIHHPYESFTSTVERFIREASRDPKVLAIKMTLYRTGDESPFVRSLIRAAEAGKQVVCLIELKARFDEERNIFWARALENAGVHVVYGVVGLKTHAKTALVVRQEAEGIRCYVHLGTGNYNSATARFYTDMGLLTCNEEIAHEVVEFFHFLTGRSLKKDYKHLLVAPLTMFAKFKAMVEREGEHAKAGRPARIIAKFNNMEENDIALALYEASQKGCPIDLIVRGFCCLRPGVKGLSENIRVMSVIGRFLEHSRIFYFRNGAKDPLDGEFYIGSVDWMYRNLHSRVETVVPVLDRHAREKIWETLQFCLNDRRQTWDMDSEGRYTQRTGGDVGIHERLSQLTRMRHTMTEISEDQQQGGTDGASTHPTRHR